MKTFLFLLFFPIALLAQQSPAFEQRSAQLQGYLSAYDQLYPLESLYSMTQLGLSASERARFRAYVSEPETPLADTVDWVETEWLLAYLQDAIVAEMTVLMQDSLTRPNETDVGWMGNSLDMVRSDDGRLYNFSLDEKTGGTYRSRISWMYYTAWELPEGEGAEPFAVLTGDGFNGIYAIEGDGKIQYVLTGFVRGCSYCFEDQVQLVELVDGVFEERFRYAVRSRSWEGAISYDPDTRRIEVGYETDDLTGVCFCGNEAEEEAPEADYGTGEEGEYRRFQCSCSFIYEAGNFDLI